MARSCLESLAAIAMSDGALGDLTPRVVRSSLKSQTDQVTLAYTLLDEIDEGFLSGNLQTVILEMTVVGMKVGHPHVRSD
ncbi:hypothetical protein MJD09_01645 [bacterium]|nr:hypothetical protein [bacterium]